MPITTPNRIAVIGAGLAGLTCAQKLSAGGADVHVFDKGRGPGGRMSTRRVMVNDIEIGFDHGAQYFTARDPDFLAVVRTWERQGLVGRWPAAGDGCWVGTPAMNAPISDLSGRLNVRYGHRVEGVFRSDGSWRLIGDNLPPTDYDAIVVAVPADQVSALVETHNPAFARAAAATPSAPCWTVMAAFAERLEIEADVLRATGEIRWAARNSSKPGRNPMETWVIQASADWSRQNRGIDPAQIVVSLLDAFSRLTCVSLPSPMIAQAHSWLYARSGSHGDGYLWDPEVGLGVCGDWLLGPRVECAWLSGNGLAKRLSRPSI